MRFSLVLVFIGLWTGVLAYSIDNKSTLDSISESQIVNYLDERYHDEILFDPNTIILIENYQPFSKERIGIIELDNILDTIPISSFPNLELFFINNFGDTLNAVVLNGVFFVDAKGFLKYHYKTLFTESMTKYLEGIKSQNPDFKKYTINEFGDLFRKRKIVGNLRIIPFNMNQQVNYGLSINNENIFVNNIRDIQPVIAVYFNRSKKTIKEFENTRTIKYEGDTLKIYGVYITYEYFYFSMLYLKIQNGYKCEQILNF